VAGTAGGPEGVQHDRVNAHARAATDGCKQLSAFVKQVKASIKARKLSATIGQALINAAEAIEAQVGCS
jgi:hypothetical protein